MLLAVDTSTQWVGIALYDSDRVVAELAWQTRFHHTVELAPAVQDLMQRSGIKPAELKALAVALGPGSFTSLRIGMALVKGMALALKIPVVGIPTLDVVAAAQPLQELPMAAILQAGRGRLAVGWYHAEKRGWKLQGEAALMNIEDLSRAIEKPTLVCGEITEAERQTLGKRRKTVLMASPAHSTRRPGFLAELAWKRWQNGHADDPALLAPIYLRVADPIPE